MSDPTRRIYQHLKGNNANHRDVSDRAAEASLEVPARRDRAGSLDDHSYQPFGELNGPDLVHGLHGFRVELAVFYDRSFYIVRVSEAFPASPEDLLVRHL
jgi:hypothetical protein